jgi:hypothetical protein
MMKRTMTRLTRTPRVVPHLGMQGGRLDKSRVMGSEPDMGVLPRGNQPQRDYVLHAYFSSPSFWVPRIERGSSTLEFFLGTSIQSQRYTSHVATLDPI